MGLFGRKSGHDGGGGGVTWLKAIQEAKVQNTRMNDLKNIYQDNKNSGAHMVWQHLRDQSGNKMESHTSIKNKSHHELYVQRALKKAAQNENYSRDTNFISSNTRDQVLLMFRAAQKNKTKASQMLGGKLKHDNVSYLPGMLTGRDSTTENLIADVEMDEEIFYDEEESKESPSDSSTLAYQKIHVEPLAQSSRNVSRSSLSWQPLSMTALQEYSPQISVNTKTTGVKEKLWNVI